MSLQVRHDVSGRGGARLRKKPMSQIALSAAIALTLFLAGSTRAADDSYEVSKTDASLTAGGKGKASVTISAKKGWHLNAEAPLTLKLVPQTGVEVDKAKLGRGDLAASNEKSARFDVGVTTAPLRFVEGSLDWKPAKARNVPCGSPPPKGTTCETCGLPSK